MSLRIDLSIHYIDSYSSLWKSSQFYTYIVSMIWRLSNQDPVLYYQTNLVWRHIVACNNCNLAIIYIWMDRFHSMHYFVQLFMPAGTWIIKCSLMPNWSPYASVCLMSACLYVCSRASDSTHPVVNSSPFW
jgi:hypothetical protein